MESLRDRIVALADARSRVMGDEIDEFDGKEQREVALAAARMAIETALQEYMPMSALDQRDYEEALLTLRDSLTDI